MNDNGNPMTPSSSRNNLQSLQNVDSVIGTPDTRASQQNYDPPTKEEIEIVWQKLLPYIEELISNEPIGEKKEDIENFKNNFSIYMIKNKIKSSNKFNLALLWNKSYEVEHKKYPYGLEDVYTASPARSFLGSQQNASTNANMRSREQDINEIKQMITNQIKQLKTCSYTIIKKKKKKIKKDDSIEECFNKDKEDFIKILNNKAINISDVSLNKYPNNYDNSEAPIYTNDFFNINLFNDKIEFILNVVVDEDDDSNDFIFDNQLNLEVQSSNEETASSGSDFNLIDLFDQEKTIDNDTFDMYRNILRIIIFYELNNTDLNNADLNNIEIINKINKKCIIKINGQEKEFNIFEKYLNFKNINTDRDNIEKLFLINASSSFLRVPQGAKLSTIFEFEDNVSNRSIPQDIENSSNEVEKDYKYLKNIENELLFENDNIISDKDMFSDISNNIAIMDAISLYIDNQFDDKGNIKEDNINGDLLDSFINENKEYITDFIQNDNSFNIIDLIKESINEAKNENSNNQIIGGESDNDNLKNACGAYIEQTIAVLNGDIAEETIIHADKEGDNHVSFVSHPSTQFETDESKFTYNGTGQNEDKDEIGSNEDDNKPLQIEDHLDNFQENIKSNIETIIEETDEDLREYSEYTPSEYTQSESKTTTNDIKNESKYNNLINNSYKRTIEKIKERMDSFKNNIKSFQNGSVRSSTTGAITRSAKERDRNYKVVHNIASTYLSNILNNSNLSLEQIDTAGSSKKDGRNALVQSMFSHMLGGANIKFNGSTFREDMARASTGIISLGANNRQQMINCWGKRVTYITERYYSNKNEFLEFNRDKITSAKDINMFKARFLTHKTEYKPKCYICGCEIQNSHFPEVEHKLPCVGFYSQIYNIAAYPNLKKYWISFIDNTKYDKIYGLFNMLINLYDFMHIKFNEDKIFEFYGYIFALFEKYLKKYTKYFVIGNTSRNQQDLDHFKLILLAYLSEFTWSHHTCNQIKTNYDLRKDEGKFKPQMVNFLEGKPFKGAVIKKNMVDAESDGIRKYINVKKFNERYNNNLIKQINYLNKKISEFAGIQELTKKRLFIRTLKRIYITQKNDNENPKNASKNRANVVMKLIKKITVELKKIMSEGCHEIINCNYNKSNKETRSTDTEFDICKSLKNKIMLPFFYLCKGIITYKNITNNFSLDVDHEGSFSEGLTVLNKLISIFQKESKNIKIYENKKNCLNLIIFILIKVLLSAKLESKEINNDPLLDNLDNINLDINNEKNKNNEYFESLTNEFIFSENDSYIIKSIGINENNKTLKFNQLKINIDNNNKFESIEFDDTVDNESEINIKGLTPGFVLNYCLFKNNKEYENFPLKNVMEKEKGKLNTLIELKKIKVARSISINGGKKKRKNNSKRKRKTIKKNKKKNTKKKYKNRKKYTRKYIKK